MSNAFYDTSLLGKDEMKDLDIEESLMEKVDEFAGKNEDVEKVKNQWAYNLPCALLVNGGQKYWLAHLKPIYKILLKDTPTEAKTALSAGFKELINLVSIEKLESKEERQFILEIMN